jgi:hypothetical protein
MHRKHRHGHSNMSVVVALLPILLAMVALGLPRTADGFFFTSEKEIPHNYAAGERYVSDDSVI